MPETRKAPPWLVRELVRLGVGMEVKGGRPALEQARKECGS